MDTVEWSQPLKVIYLWHTIIFNRTSSAWSSHFSQAALCWYWTVFGVDTKCPSWCSAIRFHSLIKHGLSWLRGRCPVAVSHTRGHYHNVLVVFLAEQKEVFSDLLVFEGTFRQSFKCTCTTRNHIAFLVKEYILQQLLTRALTREYDSRAKCDKRI